MHIVLFFTEGVSLKRWDRVGILSREIFFYKKLITRGHKISFITYGERDDLQYQKRLNGIRVYCNRFGIYRSLYKKLIWFIHYNIIRKADILKTNQMFGADAAITSSKLLSKLLIVRLGYLYSGIIFEEFGFNSIEYNSSLNLESKTFNNSDHIIVTTQAIKSYILKKYNIEKKKISIIPNFIQLENFKPNSNIEKVYEMIFIGRIEKQKNIETLIKVMIDLQLKILIIGNGRLNKYLERKFESLCRGSRWIKNVNNTKIPFYIHQSKFFILPSFYEGQPKSLLEAMACGIPIIGADSPGINQLITHKKNGILCDTDHDSIKTAILELDGDTEMQNKIIKNGIKYITHHFSPEKNIQKELDIYHKIIKSE